MIVPLILVFVFMTGMAVYISSLMYRIAVSNTNAVMEDRILTVSAMINNHLNTAENVLHVAGDSVHHMLISGTTTARIHEFLVDETANVTEQFDENYTGLYGYIMGKYIDGLNWAPPEGYDPKTRDWYIYAMEADGRVVFTPLYIDAQTGNLITSACRVLPDRQSVIALDVQLEGIQAMMSELTISGKGYGFVVDENGLIIAHEDGSLKGSDLCDIPGGEDFLRAINDNGYGSFSYTWQDEKTTVYTNRISN
ncbi:MAG: cache domain-containing protein, partial [Lachnospiraceae bacterium]|nr:cache domain-containing protein [Lachnospiraceae bacterium]